jgi:cysteine synthase A
VASGSGEGAGRPQAGGAVNAQVGSHRRQHRRAIFEGLRSLVGNTPLLAIELAYRGEPRVLYAKAEYLNMTGSIKDRMALHIMRRGYARGLLHGGERVIEATSGNTGIAIAAVASALGHPVTIFMPDWMSHERIELLRCYGAEMRLVRRDEGGFVGCIEQAEILAQQIGSAYLPRQFSNPDNVEAHYQTTAPELWWQLRAHGLGIDAFVAGVGTGGTIMGVGRYLREQQPGVRVHPLEPADSPILTAGHRVGKHRIQGISDEFVPPIVDLDELDGIVSVPDGDAILMAQKLARTLGLGVGISSGANFLGALQVQNDLGSQSIVATVFPDDNKKYLSTDLRSDEPVKPGFLTPDVELLGFRSFGRVCRTCFDQDEWTFDPETQDAPPGPPA